MCTNYLSKNRRYNLEWIGKINNENIIVRSPLYTCRPSLITPSFFYNFEREEGDTDILAAIFKGRIPVEKETLKLLKERVICLYNPGGGSNYIYTETDMGPGFGDYPKYEERIRRLREKHENKRKFMESLKAKEKEENNNPKDSV